MTLLNQAKSMVNILALNIEAAPRTQGTGSPGVPSILCQVVDKSAPKNSAAAPVWSRASIAWSLSFTALSTAFLLL